MLKGSKVDLKVTFHPDHTSELYSDTMHISIVSNEKNSRVIHLTGKSRANNMYLRGVEPLSGNTMSTEPMILVDLDEMPSSGGLNDEEATTKKGGGGQAPPKGVDAKPKADVSMSIPVLVILYSMPSHKASGEFTQAEKIIHIGCMKSSGDKKESRKVRLQTHL